MFFHKLSAIAHNDKMKRCAGFHYAEFVFAFPFSFFFFLPPYPGQFSFFVYYMVLFLPMLIFICPDETTR